MTNLIENTKIKVKFDDGLTITVDNNDTRLDNYNLLKRIIGKNSSIEYYNLQLYRLGNEIEIDEICQDDNLLFAKVSNHIFDMESKVSIIAKYICDKIGNTLINNLNECSSEFLLHHIKPEYQHIFNTSSLESLCIGKCNYTLSNILDLNSISLESFNHQNLEYDKYEILFNFYVSNYLESKYKNERYIDYSNKMVNTIEEYRQIMKWDEMIIDTLDRELG